MAMQQRRLLISIGLGLLAGLYPLWRGNAGDLGGSLCLARALFAGMEPYSACPMQVAHDPLTAALILSPLLLFSPALAGAVWNAATTTLLAWLLLDGPRWRLLAFASVGYALTLFYSQWGALLLAVAVYPNLLPLALGKPHTGLVLGLWRFSWQRIVICSLVLILSILLYPAWPITFLRQATAYTTTDNGFIPVLIYPWLLFLLFKWRDDHARLILLMACVPQRGLYNLLPLLLVPQSRRTMLFAILMGWIGVAVWAIYGQHLGMLVSGYLPALALVIAPDVQRWISRWKYKSKMFSKNE